MDCLNHDTSTSYPGKAPSNCSACHQPQRWSCHRLHPWAMAVLNYLNVQVGQWRVWNGHIWISSHWIHTSLKIPCVLTLYFCRAWKKILNFSEDQFHRPEAASVLWKWVMDHIVAKRKMVRIAVRSWYFPHIALLSSQAFVTFICTQIGPRMQYLTAYSTLDI